MDLIEQAVIAGVPLIQIREKHLFTRLLLELASKAVRTSAGSQTKILVNDRADVASDAGAHGVHLTERSMPADVIRKSFPELEIVGVSAHTLDGVLIASRMKADFSVFGPVFSTPGKGSPLGIETLKEICDAAKPFPVIALGGIDADNFEDVLNAGAGGFAAIRFLSDPDSFGLLSKAGFLSAPRT